MQKNLLSLKALCTELSISEATGRNWLRLGKLTPTAFAGSSPRFAPSYVKALKGDLLSGRNTSLKSRRNKSYISGSGVYASYVSDDSPNLPVVQAIVASFDDIASASTGLLLTAVLAECAIQLLLQRFPGTSSSGLLREYLAKELSSPRSIVHRIPVLFLIDDLLRGADSEDIASVISSYPELFDLSFTHVPGEDTLGLLYISLKNLGKRKAEGAYYTPTFVVDRLCRNLFDMHDISGRRILDPCCGTGNFLLQLPDEVSREMVYGSDTDPVSIRLARINYCLKFGVTDKELISEHIAVKDFLLDSDPVSDQQAYDFIIGNPPWGSRFSDAEKARLRETFSSARGRNIESYDVFTEQALRLLTPGGVLSFVLPEAVLNVRYHTAVRRVLLEESCIEYVEFLGDVFDRVHCPSIILQLRRSESSFDTKGLIVTDRGDRYEIGTSRRVSPASFDFFMTDEEYEIIERLDNLEGKVTLKGNAEFALGIVTGDNKKFISHEKTSDNEIIVKGSDLGRYVYVPSDNYIEFDPDAFQQVADVRLYRAPQKLFYKFISDAPVFAYDDTGALSLNSCNILIPAIPGLDIRYVLAVLNSGAVRFYYKKKFNSVKVLRSHLEQIPIPMADAASRKKIVDLVNRILRNRDAASTDSISERIDREVSKLYNLTESQCSSIMRRLISVHRRS